MPKGPKKLTSDEKQTIRDWILQGAKTIRIEPADPESIRFTEEELSHWAFQPVNLSVSTFFNFFIAPLAPYTVGSMVWDQAERDVHCFAQPGDPYAETDHYACLEKELIRSWQP